MHRETAPVTHRHCRDQRAERATHCLLYHSLHPDSVAKANLEFGRVDVDIDIFGSHLDS